MAGLALGSFTDFANGVLSSDQVVGEWIAGLNVRANIDQLIARYGADGLEFWAQADAVSLSAHRGAPSISNSQAEVFGDLQQIALRVTGDAITMQFPELFTNAWDLEDVKVI